MKILPRRPRASIVVAIALSCPSAALACDCAPLDLRGRLAAADLVVVARVTSFTPLRLVKASPVETFKGRSPPSVTIRTGESDCDLFLPPENPEVGAEYLLYLRRSGGEFTASRCLAPRSVAERDQELRELRRPAWQRHSTAYLSLELPRDWRSETGEWGRVRFDAPQGPLAAAVWIGAHERGRWKSLDEFMREHATKDRRPFIRRTIRGAAWAETRDESEGTVEITLYAVHGRELVQVMVDYDSRRKARYGPIVDRILDSLVLPVTE